MNKELLKNIEAGQFFSVTFRKRTDGSLRTMHAKFGVKKYVKGGERAYDFDSKGLLPVFDMDIKEYRCIPLDSILSLTLGGKTYEGDGLLEVRP